MLVVPVFAPHPKTVQANSLPLRQPQKQFENLLPFLLPRNIQSYFHFVLEKVKCYNFEVK
jgi:hypothetical protein